jgi:hypothetical protein
LIWNYTTGGLVWSSPAVVNGIVYISSMDGNVYAFGPPYALIFGRITNLTTNDDNIVFDTINIKVINFKPFSFHTYTSGEQFIILNDYKGLLWHRFILAFCKIIDLRGEKMYV